MKALFHLIIAALILSGGTTAGSEPLRLGITSASARGQYVLLEEWRAYLQQKIDHPVEFVFRESYLENIDLIKQKKLDFAWISPPAYLENMQHTRLLATPLYQGKPYDRSYLVVSTENHEADSLQALENKIFAYVDPDSSTGYLEPRNHLRLSNKDPNHFFRRTFFTHDDQKVVAAVAIGLADAGSMSGFAWEMLALSHPEITAQTRIVTKSADYGFPPIIARKTMGKRSFDAMQRALIEMSSDPDGIKLLRRLNIDGFIVSGDKLYRDVYLMMRRAGDL